MKNILIIIAMFSLSLAGEMGLSAYGGLNLGSISYEESCSDCLMRPGLSLGVNYSKPTLPVILGAGISMRGNKMEMTVDPLGDIKSEIKFMYLDLSAIFPYPLGPGGVFAGIDIGMPLSAEGCSTVGTASEVCNDIEDVNMDFGLSLGYAYPINEMMAVYASYYMGLVEITEDSKSKHTGIGLGMSYELPF